jgi:hypothetical protein
MEVVMRLIRTAALLSALVASSGFAAGFSSSANFVVFTPSTAGKEAGQRFAERVLERAEEFRAQVAHEWFGEALPAGGGRTVVNVELSDREDSGITWAMDHPARRFHNIYLTTSTEHALGATLHHEIAHAVLATRYPHPHRLPVWLEEGIASRYDDPATLAARLQIIRSWGQLARAPQLRRVLAAQKMTAHGADGRSLGWDAALRAHYRIAGVDRLQAGWEAWVQNASVTASDQPRRASAGT